MADHPRFRIGNQTACSSPSLLEPFEFAVQNGFDAFEWFPDRNSSGAGWDESSLDRHARQSIKQTASAHDIRLSVHAPWQANPLLPETHALLLRQLDFARDIGARILNIHLYVEGGVKAYVAAIAPLSTLLAEAGIQLSIENTPLTTPEHFNELFETLGLESRNIGMCLDIGHANLCASTRNNYLRYFDELHRQVPIVHAHLHENWGDSDSHLTLFTGPAGKDSRGVEGVLRRLQDRKFSGSMILEQWPQPPSLLTAARDRLSTLLAIQFSESHADGDEAAFVRSLAGGNARARSWREKLELVHSLVEGRSAKLSVEQLVYLAIYLRFLGTGEVVTVEDGRHFRPSHASKASIEIQDELAKIAAADKQFVLRKILPWLPSSDRAFTTAEPLTRIRDIAHRNDIPQDLKREIKDTLQNKLHRCAGPEDLVTCTAILKRITAPGTHYSSDFVDQFKIFHAELKEFFNARSLEEQLRSIAVKHTAPDEALLHQFLEKRKQIDGNFSQQFESLQLSTDLRRSFADPIGTNPGSATQEIRLADVALESFVFVLLSRMINGFEEVGPPHENHDWLSRLRVLQLTIANVALSGFSAPECRAVDNELTAWCTSFTSSDRDQLLRLKATVDRSRRLADEYSGRVMALFPSRVARLGHLLGVAETAIRTFVEGDIRGNVVFQLSKLSSILTAAIRKTAGLPPQNVIVPGKAAGRLITLDSLDTLRDPPPGRVLVLLETAQGDEELPPAVAGIVLAHEIPYLSHLAVRARQAKVVLICCDDRQTFTNFSHLNGQWAVLEATVRGVTLDACTPQADRQDVPSHAAVSPDLLHALHVQLNPAAHCLPLDRVLPENAGAKASGARNLEELSHREGAGFLVPRSLVVPFGVMEECLNSMPEINAQYADLSDRLNNLSAEQFSAAAEQLRLLIGRLLVPNDAVEAIARAFASPENRKDVRLMVRSSANCEDLTQLAGAGLYDSIANVSPAQLSEAIRTVWMSLWTERAAFSRRQSGIPHRHAHMAVLVQEMLVPEYSFILHTVNPITRDNQEVYSELAVGLGEILASATEPGSPYRMICDKRSGAAQLLAFASISHAVPRRLVDYSKVQLSTDLSFLKALGASFAAIGKFVETAFVSPQDVEGAIVASRIYLVQSRPQQGL